LFGEPDVAIAALYYNDEWVGVLRQHDDPKNVNPPVFYTVGIVLGAYRGGTYGAGHDTPEAAIVDHFGGHDIEVHQI
jgi:hypothetical protein